MLCVAALSACRTSPDGFAPEHQDRLAFLEQLRRGGSGAFTFEQPTRGWITERDLPQLFRLIDSRAPCMSVAMASSSRLRVQSTVGDEAAFMIEGFRSGRYPPALNSTEVSAGRKDELRTWWAARARHTAPPDLRSGH